ncbi:MAG: hypothetical protein IJY24_01180 [Clostridia bacterium]|nr:hypothetical protein [Clostridia bacterium]
MKIGFIDYYLSEWHANNYPTWIKEICERDGADFELAYAWAELDTSPLDGVTTAEWCARFGAEKCDTLAEICDKSDALLILSPSNPEKHLPYAKIALTYGKPTYIDKTFAPSVKEAEEIFAIGEAHSTPVFSSSALRYAKELALFKGEREVCITGGGSNLAEYIVHQAEIAETLMGVGVCNVEYTPGKDGKRFTLHYADSRRVEMLYHPELDFTLSGAGRTEICSGSFFIDLLTDILAFYKSGKPPIQPADTIEVMRIRECALALTE